MTDIFTTSLNNGETMSKLDKIQEALDSLRGDTLLLKRAVDYRDDSRQVLLSVGDIDTKASFALKLLDELREEMKPDLYKHYK